MIISIISTISLSKKSFVKSITPFLGVVQGWVCIIFFSISSSGATILELVDPQSEYWHFAFGSPVAIPIVVDTPVIINSIDLWVSRADPAPNPSARLDVAITKATPADYLPLQDLVPGDIVNSVSVTDIPLSNSPENSKVSVNLSAFLNPCELYFVTVFGYPNVLSSALLNGRYLNLRQDGNGQWFPNALRDVVPRLTIHGNSQPTGDLTTRLFAWDEKEGGLKFRYGNNGSFGLNGTAKIYWAKGADPAMILSQISFPTIYIDGCFRPEGTIIRVPGSYLREAPAGTTHVLFIVEPDHPELDTNPANNVMALPDVRLKYVHDERDRGTLSDYSVDVLKGLLREAGQKLGQVTRTMSSYDKQAQIMYDNELAAEKAGKTTKFSYKDPGQQVINRYKELTLGKTLQEKTNETVRLPTIAAMAQLIKNLFNEGKNVSLHCADFKKLNVLDLYMGDFIENKRLFAAALCRQPKVSRRLVFKEASYLKKSAPCVETIDPANCFHIEIPQPAQPLQNPALFSSIRDSEAFSPRALSFTLTFPNIQEACSQLETTAGFGFNSQTTTNGRVLYSFHAEAGDTLEIKASVNDPLNDYLPGDSTLYLFDSTGRLLAFNDDDQDEGLGSSLFFQANYSGDYFVAASTFGNSASLDESDILKSWDTQSGNLSEFDLSIAIEPPSARLFLRKTTGDEVIFSWMGDGVLQEADRVEGPWRYVVGAASPMFVDKRQPQNFLRIAHGGDASNADLTLKVLNSPRLFLTNKSVISIQVRNSGPAEASSIRLTNLFGPGISVVAVTSSAGTCAFESGVVHCDIDFLQATSNVVISAEVVPTVCGTVQMSGVVSSDQDPVSTNNVIEIPLFIDAPLTISDGLLTEGPAGSTNTFIWELKLNQASTLPVSVTYATESVTALEGQDFLRAVGTVTIPPGEVVARVPLQIIGDAVNEGDEYFRVRINSSENARIIGNSFSTVLIRDDDQNRIFSNDDLLFTADNGPAFTYPSVIEVSGIDAASEISKVGVVIKEFRCSYPSGIDMLLVSPNGSAVMLMSRVGGDSDVFVGRLTFTDDALSSLSTSPIVSGEYKPTGFGSFFGLPPPAPDPPYGDKLSTFNGSNANGRWQLFINSRTRFMSDEGLIASWSLSFEFR